MTEREILIQRVDNNEIKVVNQCHTFQLSSFDANIAKVSQYLTQAILLEVSSQAWISNKAIQWFAQ